MVSFKSFSCTIIDSCLLFFDLLLEALVERRVTG